MKDGKAGIPADLWVKLIFIARVLGAAWCRPGAPPFSQLVINCHFAYSSGWFTIKMAIPIHTMNLNTGSWAL